MVCALTGGGITFCKFSLSQGFNSQNRLHVMNPHVFLLHLNTSASVWSCRSTSEDSYGMRLDRWRDHVLPIFSQPRLQFTKPVACDESSRVPAPFEYPCFVWSCHSTSEDSYGMRLDRWRDHVLQIFSQPRLQFTKPIARDESSRVPAPFEHLCFRLELPFHLRG